VPVHQWLFCAGLPRCSSSIMHTALQVKQPRFFCKVCERHWTQGGALRDVAAGAGRRHAPKPGRTTPGRGGGSSGGVRKTTQRSRLSAPPPSPLPPAAAQHPVPARSSLDGTNATFTIDTGGGRRMALAAIGGVDAHLLSPWPPLHHDGSGQDGMHAASTDLSADSNALQASPFALPGARLASGLSRGFRGDTGAPHALLRFYRAPWRHIARTLHCLSSVA
jgi:Dof domain, zinc finger